jgi:hypothetical protein
MACARTRPLFEGKAPEPAEIRKIKRGFWMSAVVEEKAIRIPRCSRPKHLVQPKRNVPAKFQRYIGAKLCICYFPHFRYYS